MEDEEIRLNFNSEVIKDDENESSLNSNNDDEDYIQNKDLDNKPLNQIMTFIFNIIKSILIKRKY